MNEIENPATRAYIANMTKFEFTQLKLTTYSSTDIYNLSTLIVWSPTLSQIRSLMNLCQVKLHNPTASNQLTLKISNPDFDQIGVIRSLEALRKRYNRILPKGHFLGVNGPLFSQILIL